LPSKLWFMEHARHLGEKKADIICSPRCTESYESWNKGGEVCAIISGAFSVSANQVGRLNEHVKMGGVGWIANPSGETLSLTSAEQPYVVHDIDLAESRTAKKTYPRYVDASAVANHVSR
jgi:hypothetical protein